MRTVKTLLIGVLLLLLSFLAWAEVNAHETGFINLVGPINLELLNSILDGTKEEIFLLDDNSGRFPTASELDAIARLISAKGKIFGGGFTFSTGDLKRDSWAAHFFLYGDGSIVWALETFSRIYYDGGAIYRRWKFFLHKTILTISFCQLPGSCKDMLYEEEIEVDSSTISESRRTIEKIVNADTIMGHTGNVTNTCFTAKECN